MVKWVPDVTKRFRRRPHFEPAEIDRECECLVSTFLLKHRGEVRFPLLTDELTVLIELHVDRLDLYADLSADGHDVEGVARFAVGQRPVIEIASALSEDNLRENRLRTTLAHELGHAKLHDPLFQARGGVGGLLDTEREVRVVCKREQILEAPRSDWMEWQAGYASGALLVPRSAVSGLLRPLVDGVGRPPPFHVADAVSQGLINPVAEAFAVSRDAARVRLTQLGYITATTPAPTLFG